MQRTKEPTPTNGYGLPNVVVPAEAFFNENLTANEKLMFGLVINFTRNEYGYAWISNRALGRYLGCTPEKASAMLSKLHNEGYLVLEYQTEWDGRNVRKIYVDNNYMFNHEETLREGLIKIKRPLNHSVKGSQRNDKGPQIKALSKLESDIESDIENNLLSEDRSSDSENDSKRTNGKPNPQERSKQYLPKAESLAEIIQTNKNIKITQSKLKGWANEIRKLIEQEGIDPSRIDAALDWYRENIGGEYVPVIESGSALRQKFIRLENAIERDTKSKDRPSQTEPKKESPKAIIRKASLPGIPNPKYFIRWYYEPAKELLSYSSNGQLPELAKNLVTLYQTVYDEQEKIRATKNSMKGIPERMENPGTLIEAYTRWLDNQSWMKDKQPNLFDYQHKLFRKFLGEHAYDIGANPITGKYPDQE